MAPLMQPQSYSNPYGDGVSEKSVLGSFAAPPKSKRVDMVSSYKRYARHSFQSLQETEHN